MMKYKLWPVRPCRASDCSALRHHILHYFTIEESRNGQALG